jgi:ribosomal protein S12 methylthiotransferase
MALHLPIIDPPSGQTAERAADASTAVRGRYSVVSLGCPKNTVDTEQMLGRLQHDGFALVAAGEPADLVVINTCGFIESARQESLAAIDEALQQKRAGRVRGVIVAGCLAERAREALLAERPEIDGLVGVFGRDEITGLAQRILDGLGEQRSVFRPAPIRALADNDRLAVTPKHFAYLKISEGCDRLCTFCAIPKMRGKHASKPLEQVVTEARQLAESGVQELIVVAQDTTYYGLDLYGRPRLTELLRELDAIDGLRWIRLMYFYPMYIDQPLIEVIGGAQRILPYIDMPLQHASDRMLRRMSRRVDRSQTEQLIEQLRAGIPNLVLRTTFITGFPGETEEDFRELRAFVKRQRFERLGVFTYSFEPDTPAARLPDQLPEEIKHARRDELMAVQQKQAFAFNRRQLGRVVDVIIDRAVPGESQAMVGRTMADAPDIDGLTFVTPTDRTLTPGSIVRCEIVGMQDYDLIAVALPDEAHPGRSEKQSSTRRR